MNNNIPDNKKYLSDIRHSLLTHTLDRELKPCESEIDIRIRLRIANGKLKRYSLEEYAKLIVLFLKEDINLENDFDIIDSLERMIDNEIVSFMVLKYNSVSQNERQFNKIKNSLLDKIDKIQFLLT